MKKMDCDNIVKLVEVFQDETVVCIVQEFCNAGDLENMIRFNGLLSNHRLVRRIASQLVEGICHMH